MTQILSLESATIFFLVDGNRSSGNESRSNRMAIDWKRWRWPNTDIELPLFRVYMLWNRLAWSIDWKKNHTPSFAYHVIDTVHGCFIKSSAIEYFKNFITGWNSAQSSQHWGLDFIQIPCFIDSILNFNQSANPVVECQHKINYSATKKKQGNCACSLELEMVRCQLTVSLCAHRSPSGTHQLSAITNVGPPTLSEPWPACRCSTRSIRRLRRPSESRWAPSDNVGIFQYHNTQVWSALIN